MKLAEIVSISSLNGKNVTGCQLNVHLKFVIDHRPGVPHFDSYLFVEFRW